jgi:FtsP/CotA-like multicopper oxidase with cupredoxin domain
MTQVCLGDRIIVDVQNNIAGGQLAIHWHGVFQQGTQYMDGVPMITQCSIHEADVFRYDFLANNEGTHYWHSHDGKYCSSGSEGAKGKELRNLHCSPDSISVIQ